MVNPTNKIVASLSAVSWNFKPENHFGINYGINNCFIDSLSYIASDFEVVGGYLITSNEVNFFIGVTSNKARMACSFVNGSATIDYLG